jgi:hypothetical protein
VLAYRANLPVGVSGYFAVERAAQPIKLTKNKLIRIITKYFMVLPFEKNFMVKTS